MNKTNRFIDIADKGCGVVLLLGSTTSFLILIAVIGLCRSCMGYDEIDIDNSYMVKRYQFDRAYVEDSTGNGYELLWFTTDYVTEKRYKEILTRKPIWDSYKRLEAEAGDHFNHRLIETDIYDFVKWAKRYDIDPDVRLTNIWVYGTEYKKLYRQPNERFPEVQTPFAYDIGILFLKEFDVYPYNLQAGRTYRYWQCEVTSSSDERFSHVTEQDYLQVKQ